VPATGRLRLPLPPGRPVLVPKLVTTMKQYTRAQFSSDLVAGIIVGIVALPLAIAFAIASGVTPDRGLWTAIVAGFLISALGGSRVQIGGPTGAFVVIVYGIVQQHGVDGLLVATLMAGVILVAMGLLRLGVAIKFIPHPLVIGFTTGIALIIASTQVKDFLGLRMGDVPAEFVGKWAAFGEHIGTTDPTTTLVGLLALAIILGWPKVNKRVPGPFVALLVTTLLVQALELPVATIGTRFGQIASAFPDVRVPALSFTQVASLVGPAVTIAMLAAVESLLSAVVADGMIGGRHRSNMELVAQGVANIGSSLVGGIPATGAIARTATNVRNGGRTPVAGMVHALVLLVITLFAGRWATMIPLATLAAILLVVAYHMSEWRVFRAELRGPRSDMLVLLLTFALTVLVDLTVAIGVGVVLASFLFTRQMAESSDVRLVAAGLGPEDEADTPLDDPQMRLTGSLPAAVQVYEVTGALFFGAASTFRDRMAQLVGKPKVLVLRLRAVPAMDSSGLRALAQFVDRSRADGIRVLLAEVPAQPLDAMRRGGLLDTLGDASVFATLEDAVAFARDLLEAPRV
jgi:SulP family sulfate permease